MCGRVDENKLTLDHIIPKSMGGPGRLDNLQILCRRCHIRKDINTPAEAVTYKIENPKVRKETEYIEFLANEALLCREVKSGRGELFLII